VTERYIVTVKSLIEQAKKLSKSEQAELLDALICLEDDIGLTIEQQADLDKRIDELNSGKAELIDGDEVFRQLRERQ
jgi:hypothetical protein